MRLVGHHFDFQGPTVERQPPVSEGVRGQRVPAQQEDQLRHWLPLGLQELPSGSTDLPHQD